MNEARLTHEQRIEIVRRLEASANLQAGIILEYLDRLLSGEDVGSVMSSLAISLSTFQERIQEASDQ